MNDITIGITAHVDSGKTTLAEAMLYKSGSIRKLGRVDNGDSALDTDNIERSRGITIFAHQAELELGDKHISLLDTPGHIDFSAETERTMRVLDYAVLVINGTEGVQSHTSTLWKLLQRYDVPVFIFINKMDLIGADRSSVLENIRKRLSSQCTDFSGSNDEIYENAAVCTDELMEKYLGGVLKDDDISEAIMQRRIFPCCFGSALRMDGVDEFMGVLSRFTVVPERKEEFGAMVYKVSYDPKGSRLTHLKVVGGTLRMRDQIEYKDQDGETVAGKISSLRIYSGEKFRNSEICEAGAVCAVTGLPSTFAGQGLGAVSNSDRAFLEPVMTYRIALPEGKNVYEALKDMRRLEDEDPQLHILWNEQLGEINIQLMGAVQLEVLTQVISSRFGYDVQFMDGAVAYKETIREPVEGVGHYEPLRHYAEVHVLIEPLERGSGIKYAALCSEDELDKNWQRLILTHFEEKAHLGVLTGSPLTDVKYTLVAGKAHVKHTEGGDFRQATYRAIRQGLRSADSILLEPYYEYEIELPSEYVGRAISDLQHMTAEFSAPETLGDMSVITGTAPVSELNGYQQELIGYTRGRGKLSCTVIGYRECHNAEQVISEYGYDCDKDVENSADSIFCSHGGGYLVKWDEVPEHMHLPYYLNRKNDEEPDDESRAKARRFVESAVSDKELMEIFERTYGKLNTDPRRAFKKAKVTTIDTKPVKLPDYEGPDYLLVDGYNIIFAWDELKKIAEDNLDAARGELIHMMCNYQGYSGYELILVFDAYKVKGKHRDIEKYLNINIVYTKESETADTYIERVTHELSKKHRVRVATSDGIEQMIILGNGAMRISADELHERYNSAQKAVREFMESMK